MQNFKPIRLGGATRQLGLPERGKSLAGLCLRFFIVGCQVSIFHCRNRDG
jgi:hypothetical protein